MLNTSIDKTGDGNARREPRKFGIRVNGELKSPREVIAIYKAQRDELLAALNKIMLRCEGSDGSNQSPAKALISIQRMAHDAIANTEEVE